MLDEFAAALEAELRRRQVGYDGVELLRFVREVWPLPEHDPDPMPWAELFIERTCGAGEPPGMPLAARRGALPSALSGNHP
jgi:hypothetical protein